MSCGAPPVPAPDAEVEPNEECEACLAGGGTWQPEARECTADCDVQDISCFRDACPAPCAAGACGSCFSQAACDDAGCRWEIAGEAMWCRAP